MKRSWRSLPPSIQEVLARYLAPGDCLVRPKFTYSEIAQLVDLEAARFGQRGKAVRSVARMVARSEGHVWKVIRIQTRIRRRSCRLSDTGIFGRNDSTRG